VNSSRFTRAVYFNGTFTGAVWCKTMADTYKNAKNNNPKSAQSGLRFNFKSSIRKMNVDPKPRNATVKSVTIYRLLRPIMYFKKFKRR
jgi:hypothetical protein